MRKRSGYGWFELIIGIALVILGICTFIRPGGTLTGIVILYGIIAVATGISDIIFYVKTERYTGFGPVVSLISGIFSIMAGVMLLVYPAAGRWVMIMLIPLWFIAHCVSRLTHLSTVRVIAGTAYYWFALIVNIIGIILGCMMIVWPMLSLFSAGFLIGTYLVLLGVDSIVMGASKIGAGW